MNLEIPNKLEININGIIKEMKEKLRKQEKCRKLGHPGGNVIDIASYNSPQKLRCYCKDCGAYYFRSSTFEEVMEFDEMMNTPMTL